MTTDVTLVRKSNQKPQTDNLGCPLAGLVTSQEFASQHVQFHRKRSAGPHFSQVRTPASDRGILVGLSMQSGHQRRIGTQAVPHDFNADSIYIRNFDEDYRAELSGSFDFVLMEMAPAAFHQLANETDSAHFGHLRRLTGQSDPVLGSLARAMQPAFDRPQEVSRLFVDQLSVAIGTYLLHQYGESFVPRAPRSQVLSRAHERRAKELLLSRLDGEVAIAEIAEACGLSRGHFNYAFRATTGQTPYQWLIGQRIARARDLLRDPARPLADIAFECGFADQSHFTRVFSKYMGMAPGKWRRDRLC